MTAKAELLSSPDRAARAANAELRKKAFERAGTTPLEIMLEAMRWHRDVAAEEIAKGDRADQKLVSSSFKEAAALAADAARPGLCP